MNPGKSFSTQISSLLDTFPVSRRRELALNYLDYAESQDLNKAKKLLDYIIKSSKSLDEIEIFVFYHDETLLAKALGENAEAIRKHNCMKFINLNDLELPNYCLIPDVDENLNKAMFSEYLGICTAKLKEKTKLVGCFTYSIPLKFSLEWAIESGNSKLFYPPYNFEHLIDSLEYLRPEFLYGIEFNSPFNNDLGPVREAHNHDGISLKSSKGPFKGSFICATEKFLDLQNYLRDTIPWLLSKSESSLTGISSKFDTSQSSGRSIDRKQVDSRRHTYGTSLERLVTLFFCKTYKNDEIVPLPSVRNISLTRKMNWLEEAISASVNKKLTITFCDKNYITVLDKWLNFYQSAGNNNLFVFSLDKATLEFCRKKDIKSSLVQIDIKSQGLHLLWHERMRIVTSLVKIGIDVTLTDVDAIWLGDPIQHLCDNNYDIVSSMGTTFPREVYNKFGFVLCFGLITFNSTPHTLKLLHDCLNVFDEYRDDQKCLNNMLLKMSNLKVHNKQASTTQLPKVDSNELVDLYNEDISIEADSGLKIKVLSHKKFQRLFDPTTRPIVAHLLTPKEANAKNSLFDLIKQYPKCRDSAPSKASNSSVVWLASYPRSGNTMLRGWLKKNFCSNSCSIYNDPNCIGSDEKAANLVGHYFNEWPFRQGKKPSNQQLLDLKEHQNYSGNVFIKTHECFKNGYSEGKSIYIVRNGINAITSHAHYRLDFARGIENVNVHETFSEEYESIVVNGLPLCGYWSDNVISWIDYCEKNKNSAIILRFEELIKNIRTHLKVIGGFTTSLLPIEEPLLFKDSQKVDNKFYRKGDSRNNQVVDQKSLSLFYAFEHEGMIRANYISEDFEWFCVKDLNVFYSLKSSALDAGEKDALSYIINTIEKYVDECKPMQIGSRELKLKKINELIRQRIKFLESKADQSFLKEIQKKINSILKK